MNQNEIIQFILDERIRQGYTVNGLETKAGTTMGHFKGVLNGDIADKGHGKTAQRQTVGLKAITKFLDALDLKIVIEDKDANWGEDMARLRMMPKKLYVGERIEAREIIKKEGFYPRVDLFSTPEEVMKFLPGNCDIYEIRLGRLIRKKFDVIAHPFGTMYSYNEWIPPEAIVNWTTHR